MKIFRTADDCMFHQRPDKSEIYVYGGQGGSFLFKNGFFKLEHYDVVTVLGHFFNICDQVYRRVEVFDGEKVNYYLVDDTGSRLEVPQIIVKKMLLGRKVIGKRVFTAYLSGYPKRRNSSLVSYDFLNKSIISVSSEAIFSRLIDGNLYGYEDTEQLFVKRDNTLSPVWQTPLDYSGDTTSLPIKFKALIISFIGPEIEKHYSEDNASKYKISGGVLTGFNDNNGEIQWQLPIPEAIDDIGLYHNKLFIAVYNKIMLVEPESGQIVNTIDTNTSLPSYRLFAVHIFVDNNYIYFSHAADELLLIYKLDTLVLEYKVPMPQGYPIKGHQFTDNNTGKHYFKLGNFTQDTADYPSLELDPANLTTQVVFEDEPSHTLELVVVENEPLAHEVVIKMHAPRLDEGLRFGEIYTRDAASHHGFNHSGRTYGGRQPTPTFNGVIRFILSGCEQDEALVLEKLSMMQKRFTHWNENELDGYWMFACTDKSKPVQLITEYHR